MRFNIQYLIWLAVEMLKKVGILGLLGLALLLGCSLFYVTQLWTQQNKIQGLENQLLQAKANANNQTNTSKMTTGQIITSHALEKNNDLAKQVSVNDVEKFYTAFSKSPSVPGTINVIRENAQKQKLFLPKGDYKLIQTKMSQTKSQQDNSQVIKLAHYEMLLPVTGTYQQIRSFIDQVLFQLPALALSDLQIKRENTLNPLVNVRLTFVFLLHDNGLQKNISQSEPL